MSNAQRVQYSEQKISKGLDVLAHKVAKIALSASIVAPMFNGKINKKQFTINRETMPLVIILQDAIRFIYGRLGRCYFDKSGKNNNTVSIVILVDQIFNDVNNGDRKINYKAQFEAISDKVSKANSYKKKLNTFCNKHYAHTDIKTLKNTEAEEVKISIPWNELFVLISHAKEILNDMFIVCQKPSFDYSEHVYKEYADQFWSLINFTKLNVSSHHQSKES